MSITDDPDKVDRTIGPDGMQRSYLVLSEEERAKGYVRPLRWSYQHVGIPGPAHPLRDLTEDERATFPDFAKFEPYPSGGSVTGRFWTQEDLDRVGDGCGVITTMGFELAATYARSPGFYGGTFCAGCRKHFPVGANGEFVWVGTTERVGT